MQKPAEMSAPVERLVMRIDQLVAYDANVDSELFWDIGEVFRKHAKPTPSTLMELEAIRRACAVIQSVANHEFEITE